MDFEALKGFLNTYPKSLGIPGTDTVIYKDHEPIFRYTAGYDSIERGIPMRPDGIYNLYSCTKIATGVIAARLIEEGKIQIYDPVYEYIPEFKNVRVAVKDENGKIVDTTPAKSPMLIKHLLSMTSGINYNLNSESIRAVRERTGGRAPTLDACRAIANEPLEFEPGADYLYGLSLDIMAGIVEVVTGVRFKDYMRDNLLAPLGMKDTVYHIDYSKRDRFATQYEFDAKKREFYEIPFDNNPYRLGTEFDSGGAGLVSTVDDYILLMDALANGGVGKSGYRILSEGAVRMVSSNLLTSSQLSNFSSQPQMAGFGYGFGMRMALTPESSGSVVPRGIFGWDGARLCLAIADPKNRIAVFHAQHTGAHHARYIPRFRNVIYSCLNY